MIRKKAWFWTLPCTHGILSFALAIASALSEKTTSHTLPDPAGRAAKWLVPAQGVTEAEAKTQRSFTYGRS